MLAPIWRFSPKRSQVKSPKTRKVRKTRAATVGDAGETRTRAVRDAREAWTKTGRAVRGTRRQRPGPEHWRRPQRAWPGYRSDRHRYDRRNCRCHRSRRRRGRGQAGGCAGGGVGLAGTTTAFPRLGRLLTDGRISSASEMVSAATPKTKTISTPRATRNGRRPGSVSSAQKSPSLAAVYKSAAGSAL